MCPKGNLWKLEFIHSELKLKNRKDNMTKELMIYYKVSNYLEIGKAEEVNPILFKIKDFKRIL